LVIIIFCSCQKENKNLVVLFDNVAGLTDGSEVYRKGISIGRVTKMQLIKNKVLVEINLKDSIIIPIGSRFIINPSLMGPSHITIEPSLAGKYLTNKDTVIGQLENDNRLDDIGYDSAKRAKIQKSIKKIGEGFQEIIKTVEKDSDRIMKK
jgi:ABC-type transporter Mla subunit MlaD